MRLYAETGLKTLLSGPEEPGKFEELNLLITAINSELRRAVPSRAASAKRSRYLLVPRARLELARPLRVPGF